MAGMIYWDDDETVIYKTGEIVKANVIRDFFSKVFADDASGTRFPCDLDDYWMMAYTRRDSAIDALKTLGFIEKEDYEVFRNAPENLGGRPLTTYKTTVQCMEHLVARKVKPIFEIYRQCRIAITELSKKVNYGLTTTEFRERIAKSLRTHIQYIDHRFAPADYTIMSSLYAHMQTLDDVLVLHGIMLESNDRPDTSMGQRWSSFAKRLNPQIVRLPKKAPLLMPGLTVSVNVWPSSSHSEFRRWFKEDYGLGSLLDYMLNKPGFVEMHGKMAIESAVYNVAMAWTGKAHPKISAEALDVIKLNGIVRSQKKIGG